MIENHSDLDPGGIPFASAGRGGVGGVPINCSNEFKKITEKITGSSRPKGRLHKQPAERADSMLRR